MRDSDPDVELMLAFCAGDDSAFDPLFNRWGRPLLRFLERMVDDSATAEELVQEAFLRVHRARERYRPDARFSTWLYRIATNLALNELRRPHRTRPHTSSNAGTEDSDGSSPSISQLVSNLPAADQQLDVRRRTGHVERALSLLPERQRVALWLSAVEGMPYAEIAQSLDTTEKSVKALIHRARVALVASLDEGKDGKEGRQETRQETRR